MTTTAPDPKTFTSWEDAFAYPVPAVRRMEQQLRTDISSSRERLRSLVGGSYRDLLGTADTIVDMDGRMHSVEALVARTGRRCNSNLLERTKTQSRQLMAGADGYKNGTTKQQPMSKDGMRKISSAQYVLASRLAVFKACPDAVQRILRNKGSLLTAAKILIVSRMIHKQLQTTGDRFSATIESTFRRVGKVRAKLLEAVDHRLGRVPTDTSALVDAMCAYALASTASTADILKHFLKVRLSAIVYHMKHGQDHEQRPVKALQAWLQTLRDTPAIFPRQLSQTLNRLKAEPLIKNDDVSEIASLELDIHQSWLGEEIMTFVPYIRHDDLDIATAKKQMSSWAPAAFKQYLTDLKSFLEPCKDLVEVAKMRQDCLAAWFSGSSRIAGIPRSDVLSGLRGLFADQLSTMTVRRCEALDQVIRNVGTTLENWSDMTSKQTAPSLWQQEMIDMDAGHGAQKFIKSLGSSLKGRTEAVERSLALHEQWRQGIDDIEKTIKDQRKIKWQDLSDDFEDDYEDDDESRDQLLSKDDPDALEKQLEKAIEAAVDDYHESLAKIAQEADKGDDVGQKTAFLIRFLREALPLLPTSYKKPLDTGYTTKLAEPLAAPVVQAAVEKNGKRIIASLQQTQLTIRPLWSEDSQLPIMPSPWSLKIIKDCHGAMEQAGVDLWTKSTTTHLKRRLLQRLAGLFDEARKQKLEKQSDSGDDAGLAVSDVCVQQIFDVHYLRQALATSNVARDDQDAFAEHLEALAKSSNLDPSKQEQISSNAAAYWKRTSLLFALFS